MTTSKSVRRELFDSQRQIAINRLAAGVAHEFNNVLQVVNGYVRFARNSLPTDSPTRTDLDRALDATDRAARLSTRLLQFAKADDDASGIADVNDEVLSLQMLLGPITGEKISIVTDLAEKLPFVSADVSMLRQALLNLGLNARDAMPHGGTLRLETHLVSCSADEERAIGSCVSGEYVRITVADDGEGIAAYRIPRLFEPFYSTKKPDEGTGLGLAMVAEFVEQSGGGLDVTSELAVGTCFSLDLPVAESTTRLDGDVIQTLCGGL